MTKYKPQKCDICNIISNKYFIMKKNDEKMYYVCCDKCSIKNDPLCCDHVQGFYDIINPEHHFIKQMH